MVEHLPKFVERAYLNLNLEREVLLLQILMAAVDSIDDASCEVDMVVLELVCDEAVDIVRILL